MPPRDDQIEWVVREESGGGTSIVSLTPEQAKEERAKQQAQHEAEVAALIQPGRRVRLVSLKARADLNDKVGEILGPARDDGRIPVRVIGENDLWVKRTNLEPAEDEQPVAVSELPPERSYAYRPEAPSAAPSAEPPAAAASSSSAAAAAAAAAAGGGGGVSLAAAGGVGSSSAASANVLSVGCAAAARACSAGAALATSPLPAASPAITSSRFPLAKENRSVNSPAPRRRTDSTTLEKGSGAAGRPPHKRLGVLRSSQRR